MNKKDCFYLGHTVKFHGYKGEISIKLDVDEPADYKKLESVFIELNGELVPFFIEKIQIKDKGFAVVKMEGVENNDQSEKLLGREIFLPLSVLPPLKGNKFYYHEIEGFTAVDKIYGDIGTVKQVLDYPHQAILQIFKGEKEILVPATDEIISDVNRSEKIVHINAPEGLIEIYLH